MLRSIVFLLFFVISVSYGDPVKICGEIPKNILRCLDSPQEVTTSLVRLENCGRTHVSECDIMTCAFREYSWMESDGDTLNKTKLAAHFNKLAVDHPLKKPVVDHVVPDCIDRKLSPRGVYLNCPAYDLMQCLFTTYLQKSPASWWSTEAECANARYHATSCPVCPTDCFAALIPIGSCNACTEFPKNSASTSA